MILGFSRSSFLTEVRGPWGSYSCCKDKNPHWNGGYREDWRLHSYSRADIIFLLFLRLLLVGRSHYDGPINDPKKLVYFIRILVSIQIQVLSMVLRLLSLSLVNAKKVMRYKVK